MDKEDTTYLYRVQAGNEGTRRACNRMEAFGCAKERTDRVSTCYIINCEAYNISVKQSPRASAKCL